MELEGKKILLRPFRKEDLPFLYSLGSDPELTKYMTWDSYKTYKDAEDALNGPLSREEQYAIVNKKTKELMGATSLGVGQNVHFSIPEFEASFGIWLGKPFQGKHYVREVYKLIESRAKQLGIKKIYWTYDVENIRSMKASLKEGFKKMSYEGKWKHSSGRIATIHCGEKSLNN